MATRYDKLAVRYQATIHIAAIDIWLRDLERNLCNTPLEPFDGREPGRCAVVVAGPSWYDASQGSPVSRS